MNMLVAGLAIFMGMHLMPTVPTLKKKFTNLVGKKGYKPVYALVSLVGFGLLLVGYGDKPLLQIPQWQAPEFARVLALAAMWLSFVLLSAAYIPSNVKRFTRHPMLWAVAIWAAMHLWLNGDNASILLFGSFLLFSLWSMWAANMNGAKKQTKKQPIMMDIITVVVGSAAFAGVVYFHKSIAGMALI